MAWRLLSILILSVPAFSQPAGNELKSKLRSAEAAGQVDSVGYYLSLLSTHYLDNNQPDSAKLYFRRAIAFNSETENFERLAENYNNLGVLHHQQGSWDSSVYYYTEAYGVYRSMRDTTKMAVLEINLGGLYRQKGLYEKSLEYLLQASRQLEKTAATSNLATCYSMIASLYTDIGELSSSLDFHYKALTVRQKLGLKAGMSSSYNNIGNVYMVLNQLDSALANFNKSLRLKRELKDVIGQAICLNNIGELMLRNGDLKESERLLKESLAMRIAVKHYPGELSTRINLANLYLTKHDFFEAEEELQTAEKMALSLELLDELREVYMLQVRLHQQRGNVDKALDYSQRLIVVKDSLLNRDKAKAMAEMQARYESLKKEDRIKLLEKEGLLQAVELERRQLWIQMMAVGMVLILIIVALGYYNFRTVRKNKRHIELLLRELHHRVKNNLQILSSLLSLQSQQLTDDTAIRAVKSSESRINAMALIHRKLYTVDQNRTVDIKEYITELIQYLVYSYGYHEKNFKLDLEIEEISIDVDKAIPLGLILNELISNAFKHAYENQPNPRLVINLEHPDARELNISIQDNGAGMPSVDEKERKTFGMKIVWTLIRELKGNLNVKTDNGTTYHLNIPI